MPIPLVGADGVRQTVNAHLSTVHTTWNLRSALNVAALNCLEPQHAGILANYKSFLDRNSDKLASTIRALRREYRDIYGSGYRAEQDAHMTRVYNYFALPPAHDGFCDISLTVSEDALLVPESELDAFAAGALARIEAEFESFFRAYEQYRVNLAAWDAKYGRPAASSLVAQYGPATVKPAPAPMATVAVPPSAASSAPAPLPTNGPIIRPGETLSIGDRPAGQASDGESVYGPK